MKILFFVLTVFSLIVVIAHFWITFLAFSQSGIFAGLATFFLPPFGDIYWVVYKYDYPPLFGILIFIVWAGIFKSLKN